MAAASVTNSPLHYVQELILNGTAQPPRTAIASLTDSSGGTAGNTIADVPASYTEATLANQLASLTAKVNAILAALRELGLIAT